LLAAGAHGARIARKNAKGDSPTTKFIAGVPVLNYHTAYEGVPSLVEGHAREREGEWVVMANEGTSDAQLQHMCKAARKGCKLLGHGAGIPFVELKGTESDLEAVINLSQGAIKYVEPDSTVSMIPELSGNPEGATWGLDKVGADKRGRSGGSTTIFVLDTGVRTTHTEFTGRAASALDMTTAINGEKETFCDGDENCAKDIQGHGTHCAGTAAGASFGVAPAAAVRSIKVLGDDGSGSWSWSLTAMDWMSSNSARPAVASMSLGGQGTVQAIADAVSATVTKGVVVVVAGGNSNADACGFSPAFAPAAITVGSTTSNDVRSYFSNYGSCTNIWAPGTDVISAIHTDDDGSRSLSGTSMACPHVSGAAALVLDADPSKKASAVLPDLLENAMVNYISGLKTGDTNRLLYVGEDGPPPAKAEPPTPPAPTTRRRRVFR